MRCVTGRCGFNHSVGVRCTRRAPILDLHGALILFVFVIYYVVGGRAARWPAAAPVTIIRIMRRHAIVSDAYATARAGGQYNRT